MVSVKFKGRLGNQLFQYAFIYSTAKKLNTSFYIDHLNEENLLLKFFKLKPTAQQLLDLYFFKIRGYKNLFTYHLKTRFYTFFKKLIKLEEIEFLDDSDPEAELKKIKNNRAYVGHFQSEKYFSTYASDIKKLFSIRKKYISNFKNIVKNLPSHTRLVTIHVRRGDYLDLGVNLSLEYYHNAIKHISIPGDLYIIISDDPHYIEQKFSYLENKFISNHDEIIDLQFLINSDLCVLSNSSFSWWGAYLNRNKAQVFVPKIWLGTNGQEWPKGVIIPQWIKL